MTEIYNFQGDLEPHVNYFPRSWETQSFSTVNSLTFPTPSLVLGKKAQIQAVTSAVLALVICPITPGKKRKSPPGLVMYAVCNSLD